MIIIIKMEFVINIKKDTKVYTIEDNKINEYFVKEIFLLGKDKNVIESDISYYIMLKLERYNDNVSFFETTKKLSDVFLSKNDLLKQLL